MLSRFLGLVMSLLMGAAWALPSQASVVLSSTSAISLAEVREDPLVLAAHGNLVSRLQHDQRLGSGQDQAALRLAALSYEPEGLYVADGLPKILSESDRILYREIFELQELGMWGEADEYIGQLGNDILLGHVRFQRYMHPTAYRSKFMELATWLEDYADLPGSHRIYRLALKRRPETAAYPVQPDNRYLHGMGAGGVSAPPPLPTRKLSGEKRAAISSLQNSVASLISRGMPTRASKLLNNSEMRPWLTDAEFDRLSVNISRGFFSYGKDENALRLADQAAQRSRHHIPDAYWIAGLASWRLGEVAYAVQAFQNVAANDSGSNSLRAAGAFWAARAHSALGNASIAENYFQRAAKYPYTLYGLLALRALGDTPPFHWEPITLYSYDLDSLLSAANVSRAIALKEVGQERLAEQELRVYLDNFNELLEKNRQGATTISKISIQTGTSHGGVPLPDGSVANVNLDFGTLGNLSRISRENYGLAGAVQHGASTLPQDLFNKFPELETAEIHLATDFQNMIYGSDLFPASFKEEIYAHLRKKFADEKKSGQTDEQFIYKTRKKGFGEFKSQFWGLSNEIRLGIGKELEGKMDFLFDKLAVHNTRESVSQTVELVPVKPDLQQEINSSQ